ncbi:hypothetical protein SAMN04488065_0772 [Haloplanus vescus]|uniref:Uncharacterized protein n=1 Tax=Haloplanus vescus TaxID=555874 RepID=A0A1H3WDK9_9EURY|nr:hypothetical protein [Haloplanus vescus]SDZ85050.1 hypothetical protein SAMN04488065_0772 [Haloplanus vescus]
MSHVSRRQLLAAMGAVGGAALAGCSTDGETTATQMGTTTATPTATATATPRAAPDETIGFAAMLERTPTHPEMADESYVWARYLNSAGVFASVEDENIESRLRNGWLGAGPPKYADSDAFELVHVQPGGLSNVTFGRGDYDATAAVEGMVGDGWGQEGTVDGYDLLTGGGYGAAVGDRQWIIVSDPALTLVEQLVAATETDPLVDHLDAVDREAVSRAAQESGNYRVVQRSVPGDYAAGIAVDYGAYRYPVGVLQYGTNRESPSWERVERRFRTQIAGELRATDFGEDFG